MRRCIVTGAAGGIGRGIADHFLAKSYSVAYFDSDRSSLESLRHDQVTAVDVVVDVSNEAQVAVAVRQSVDTWGGVDVLVNCAGISTPHLAEDLEVADWRRVIDVNLTGAFLMSLAVLPSMRQQSWGRIVNVSSVAAKRISFNGSVAYTASKAGLLGLTRHLAYEVAHDGVNVNAICPGPTLTPLMESLADTSVLDRRRRSIPLGRLNQISDYTGAVDFLCSEAAAAICGVALDVDGGALLGWSDVEEYRTKRRAFSQRFAGGRGGE